MYLSPAPLGDEKNKNGDRYPPGTKPPHQQTIKKN
jgi:hypothetical protein